jgi:hypothetical protein
MARVRFLASTADLRPGQEGVVYGAGHETDFEDEDVPYVMEQWHAGKVEILDKTGLTPPGEEIPPEGGEEGATRRRSADRGPDKPDRESDERHRGR